MLRNVKPRFLFRIFTYETAPKNINVISSSSTWRTTQAKCISSERLASDAQSTSAAIKSSEKPSNAVHHQTVRRYSFLANERFSSHERTYMRKVLQNTSGCVLFEPGEHLKAKKFVENNQTIAKLVSVANELSYDISSAHNLLDALSQECLESNKTWPINTRLYALDVLHFVNGGKFPIYRVILKDLLEKFADLPNGPALQIMYYIARTKYQLNSDEKSAVIRKLKQNVNALALEEISIYCLALIKSKTRVNSEILVKSLFDCLMKHDLRQCADIGVSGVIKALRTFSITTEHILELKQLQTKLIPFVEKAGLMSLTHVIQLGCKQRVFNHKLIEIIIDRFSNSLDKLRIKDVERALLSISTLNPKTYSKIERNFFDQVQKHLLMSLNTKFASSLMSCISYLTVCGVVDTKLIHWALDQKTHATIYGRKITTDEHSLLLIDSYAKINLGKSYVGHKFSEQLCATLMRKICEMKTVDQRSEIGNEIYNVLNINNVHCIQSKAIPHSPFPDTFLVYNKRTKSAIQPIATNSDGSILNASSLHQNNPDLEAIVIVSCLQRQTVYNSNRYNGIFQFRLDQYRLLGFNTIVIKQSIWKLYRSNAAQRRYLALEFCKNNLFLLNKGVVFESKKNST